MQIDPTSSPINGLLPDLALEPTRGSSAQPTTAPEQPFTLETPPATQGSAAVGGVTPTGAAVRAEGVTKSLDPFAALLQVQQEFVARLAGRQEFWDRVRSGDIKPTDPAFMQEMQRQSDHLFMFQMKAQQASLGVELMSKVIEHATSSTRNVLQTQA